MLRDDLKLIRETGEHLQDIASPEQLNKYTLSVEAQEMLAALERVEAKIRRLREDKAELETELEAVHARDAFCPMPDCLEETYGSGLCGNHDEAWQASGAESVEDFISDAQHAQDVFLAERVQEECAWALDHDQLCKAHGTEDVWQCDCKAKDNVSRLRALNSASMAEGGHG